MFSGAKIIQLLLVGSCACAITFASQGAESKRGPLKVTKEDVSKAGYKFTMSLLEQLGKMYEGKNLFFSPYSISSALSMTMLGTQGASEMELTNVLGYGHCSQCSGDIHMKSGEIRKEIGDSKGVTLSISNRLFPGMTFKVKDSFLQRSESYYGSDVTQLDYANSPDTSRRFINSWVSRETNDKINDLLGPGSVTSNTRLVLANAIYFKGSWASKFDPTMTTKKIFHVDEETPVEVDMMVQKGKFKYMSNKLFDLLEMPYVGKETSLVIVLPAKFLTLRRLEHAFNAAVLNYLGQVGKVQQVVVSVPKFKLEFETDLVGTLKSLGAKSIFGSGADFRGMSDDKNLFISSVAHKAVIDVNEEGTEAAAATAGVLQRRLAPLPKRFTCDRPFFFLLKHNPTNTVLFAGRFFNPNE